MKSSLRNAGSLEFSPDTLARMKRRREGAELQVAEPLREVRRIVSASASGGALVFLLLLSACGNGGNNVASTGAEANSARNEGQVIAASPSPTTSVATSANTAENPMSPRTAQTRNSDNRSASADPKPQIGTGSNDFFFSRKPEVCWAPNRS